MNNILPPGMQKFQDELESKVFQKGTSEAWLFCEKCNFPMPLNQMNVFVYPDADNTTKALCGKCIRQEYLKHDHSKQN
jgi:hypothetical protein